MQLVTDGLGDLGIALREGAKHRVLDFGHFFSASAI
jgi:hypothetical protein